jgi:small redox-active disulfide protein 2
MKIQIIGTGCPRCQETERNVFNACAEIGLAADISHVFDAEELKRFGVAGPPVVIVDSKILVSGHVPSVAELKQLLSREGQ